MLGLPGPVRVRDLDLYTRAVWDTTGALLLVCIRLFRLVPGLRCYGSLVCRIQCMMYGQDCALQDISIRLVGSASGRARPFR